MIQFDFICGIAGKCEPSEKMFENIGLQTLQNVTILLRKNVYTNGFLKLNIYIYIYIMADQIMLFEFKSNRDLIRFDLEFLSQ